MCVCVCVFVTPSSCPHPLADFDETCQDDGPPHEDGAHQVGVRHHPVGQHHGAGLDLSVGYSLGLPTVLLLHKISGPNLINLYSVALAHLLLLICSCSFALAHLLLPICSCSSAISILLLTLLL